LQYDGQRYYDPWVGGYIQPGSVGGAPETFNRYNAASGSISSDALAVSNDGLRGDLFLGVLSVSANKTAGYYAKKVSERGITSLLRPRFAGQGRHLSTWGILSFQGSRGRFQREGLLGFFDVSAPIQRGYGGRSLFSSRGLVEQVGENAYRTATGEIIDLNSLGYGGNTRWLRNIHFRAEVVPYSKLWYPLGRELNPVARSILGEALPFGIDAAFQLAMDWNTDMPVEYRLGRAGVSGTIGVTSGILTGAALTWAWGAAGLAGGPPAWAVIGVGIIVGITIEQTTSDSINDVLFPIDR
jgi:hypothetical protein